MGRNALIESAAFGTVGTDLRSMRQRAGLSQIEVARTAKVGPEVVCRIEAGKGNPTVGTIGKVARAIRSLSRRKL